MVIRHGSVVTFNCIGVLQDSSVFIDTTDTDPITITIGNHEFIAAVESQFMGRSINETFQTSVGYMAAFGPYYNDRIFTLLHTDLQLSSDIKSLTKHQQLKLNDPEHGTIIVTVIDVDDTSVTLDGNHPLAGKDLRYTISILDIN